MYVIDLYQGCLASLCDHRPVGYLTQYPETVVIVIELPEDITDIVQITVTLHHPGIDRIDIGDIPLPVFVIYTYLLFIGAGRDIQLHAYIHINRRRQYLSVSYGLLRHTEILYSLVNCGQHLIHTHLSQIIHNKILGVPGS